MNEVYYTLSIGLVAFAAWFVFNVPALIAGSLFILVSWLVYRRTAINFFENLEEELIFAPINSPVAASLAQQLDPRMTVQEIEDFVTDRISHEGIHARMNKIER